MTRSESTRPRASALAATALVATLVATLSVGWAVANNPPPAPTPPGHARPAPLAGKGLLLAGTAITTAAGARLVAVGEYGHVLLSDDAGASWRQARSVPTVTTLTALHFIDGQRGWAVGHGGVVIATQDGGETWQALAGQLNGQDVLLSVWFRDAQVGLVVGAFGHAATTADGGKTWQTTALAEGEDGERHLNAIFGGGAAGSPSSQPGPPSLWVAAEGGVLFRSDDGGRTWQVVKLPYKGSIWGGRQLADGALLVWGMAGHVLRSDDGGLTFRELPTGTEQSLGGGTQLAGGAVVLAGLGGAVVASADGGQRFATTVRDDRAGQAAVLPGPAGRVVLLGQAGAQLHPVAGAASAPR